MKSRKFKGLKASAVVLFVVWIFLLAATDSTNIQYILAFFGGTFLMVLGAMIDFESR